MSFAEVLTSPLTTVFNAFVPGHVRRFSKLGGQSDQEKLLGGTGHDHEKVEFRIEGMTCGACVEVSISLAHNRSASAVVFPSRVGLRYCNRLFLVCYSLNNAELLVISTAVVDGDACKYI